MVGKKCLAYLCFLTYSEILVAWPIPSYEYRGNDSNAMIEQRTKKRAFMQQPK